VCTVYFVVKTKQAQRLKAGLRLHDRDATMAWRIVCVSAIEMRQWRGGSALMILVISTGVKGDDFRMGAESCPWISMQTVAALY